MNDTAFQKLWSWAALAQLTLVAVLFARTTTGGPPSSLFGFVSVSSTSVPAIGLPVDLLTGMGVLLLTLVWSVNRRSLSWAQRVPVFHFTSADVDDTSTAGKLYKAATLLVAHVLPLFATLQMGVRYLDAGVYLRSGERVISGGWSHFDYGALSAGRLKGLLNFGEPVAPETFAVLPWLYALLVTLYVLLCLATAWSVLRRKA